MSASRWEEPQGRMSTIGEPTEAEDAKEAAIIEAARKTFLARGFDAASMDAIALEAGVSKRTVYNRFRSKEDLFAAAIDETCRRILPVDISTIESNQSPEDYMREMATRFVRGILEPEALALRRIAAFEAARTPALGETYLEHGPRFLVKAVRPILNRLVERGILKIDDYERAIWQLGALLMEPLHTEALLGEIPQDLDAAIERQIESGLAAFMKLYGA
jgi:TetR/AcrR family transcriptional repressor of mexJK operon